MSYAAFPQIGGPLLVLISCQHMHGDLHAGAPHPPGAERAARSNSLVLQRARGNTAGSKESKAADS